LYKHRAQQYYVRQEDHTPSLPPIFTSEAFPLPSNETEVDGFRQQRKRRVTNISRAGSSSKAITKLFSGTQTSQLSAEVLQKNLFLNPFE
jgi:hypothetical protein